MPYCPKCDMAFIDGITVCSDCHGPLVESREAAEAMKKKEQEEAFMRLQEEYEQQKRSVEELKQIYEEEAKARPSRVPEFTHAYVSKSQKYDDMKSSASAFLLVGVIFTAFSVLCWIGMIHLPFGLVGQVSLTALGLISLAIAAKTSMDAKTVRGQISDEEAKTQQVISWFTGKYTGEQLDGQLLADYGELEPEEQSLRRFDLIQDILITNHDLNDPAYVDKLAEDIYGFLYQD